MIVIADTSPIDYLIRLGEIDVLRQLYGTVVIPRSVSEELASALAPGDVQAWIGSPPAWLEIRAPSRRADSELLEAKRRHTGRVKNRRKSRSPGFAHGTHFAS